MDYTVEELIEQLKFKVSMSFDYKHPLSKVQILRKMKMSDSEYEMSETQEEAYRLLEEQYLNEKVEIETEEETKQKLIFMGVTL